MKAITITAAAVALALGHGAVAQEAASQWHTIARSQVQVYLVDMDSVVNDGGTVRVNVAVTPMSSARGDYTHRVDVYELRCAESQYRNVAIIDHMADGSAGDRFDDAAASWDDISERGMTGVLKAVACDGERSDGTPFASVQSYIDAGRP